MSGNAFFAGSKGLFREIYGEEALRHYEIFESFCSRFSALLTRAVIESVGGRVGGNGDGCDAITILDGKEVKWEFCIDARTKKASDLKHDMERCPGRCVQILGWPRKGWTSGWKFIEIHGGDRTLEELKQEVAETMRLEAVHEKQRLSWIRGQQRLFSG